MDTYNKALNILMKSPVTDDMIQFLTHATLRVMPNCGQGAQAYPSPPTSPRGAAAAPQQPRLPSLRTFITKLVRYTNVYTPTLLATVCYLKKLQRILPKDAKGLPSTIHRLFLACLIISAKNHNDSSPLNKHWAKYTDGLFSLEDINLMERQLLQLLNWDLRLSDEDLILDLQFLLEPIKQHIEITTKQKKRMHALKKQQQMQQQMQMQMQKQNQFYSHGRNASVSSNLSAATLVSNGNGNTTSPRSGLAGASLAGSRSCSKGSLSAKVDIWHDKTVPSDLSWNLDYTPVSLPAGQY